MLLIYEINEYVVKYFLFYNYNDIKLYFYNKTFYESIN